MATLTSQSIKDTYKDMVHLYDATSATGQGFESSLKTLYDGEGVAGPVKMSSTTFNVPAGKTLSVDGSLSGAVFTDVGLPSQSGNTGKFLKTNGSVSSWDSVDAEITSVGVLTGASPLVFEGATANDYETTFTITDPTADRTITFPDSSGTVSLVGHNHSALTGVVKFDAGGTKDLPTIAKADEVDTGIYFPASDTIAFTSGGVEAGFIQSGGKLVWAGGAQFNTSNVELFTGVNITFEGATSNAYETTLTVTDPTADRTITLPDASGTVELVGHTHSGYATSGTNADITSMTGLALTALVIEGTANDHESSLIFADPTADRSITFPDATGTVITTGNLTSITGAMGASPEASSKFVSPEIQIKESGFGSGRYSGMSYSAANLVKIGKSNTGSSSDHCDILIDTGSTLVIKGLIKQSSYEPASPPGVVEGGTYSDGEHLYFGSTTS